MGNVKKSKRKSKTSSCLRGSSKRGMRRKGKRSFGFIDRKQEEINEDEMED
jgi:hypothetical protein